MKLTTRTRTALIHARVRVCAHSVCHVMNRSDALDVVCEEIPCEADQSNSAVQCVAGSMWHTAVVRGGRLYTAGWSYGHRLGYTPCVETNTRNVTADVYVALPQIVGGVAMPNIVSDCWDGEGEECSSNLSGYKASLIACGTGHTVCLMEEVQPE